MKNTLVESRKKMTFSKNTSCLFPENNSSMGDDNHDTVAEIFRYSPLEMVISIIVQIVGIFLILTTIMMFLKHPVLQKMENVFHINLLVPSVFLLVLDWFLLILGKTGCEVFTVILLLFGPAGTFSTICIAIERYRRIVQMTTGTRSYFVKLMIIIWTTSLLLVLYPAWTIIIRMSFKQPLSSKLEIKLTCLFSMSYLYDNLQYSVAFLVIAVLMPIALKLYCYTKIFQRVRKARITRWLHDAAAHCDEHTTVLQPTQRKGNIIQIRKGSQRPHQRRNWKLLSREQSIIFKGVFSVMLVLICWLPFASFWVAQAVFGVDLKSLKCLGYFVILAKTSTVLSISHNISLNNKFRKYYIKSTFGPLLYLMNCSTIGIATEDNTSHVDSQLYISTLNVGRDKIPGQSIRPYLLEPINELHMQEIKPNTVNTKRKTLSKKVSISNTSSSPSMSFPI